MQRTLLVLALAVALALLCEEAATRKGGKSATGEMVGAAMLTHALRWAASRL